MKFKAYVGSYGPFLYLYGPFLIVHLDIVLEFAWFSLRQALNLVTNPEISHEWGYVRDKDFWILKMRNGCAQTHMISLISGYGQWRMAAPKSVWLTLISDMLLLLYKPFLNWWQTHLCLKWRLLRFINMCFFN